MAIFFDVIESTTIRSEKDEFDVRLLRRGDDDWGIDTTLHMNSTFGYSENGARKAKELIIKSHTLDGTFEIVGIKAVCLMAVKDQKELDKLCEDPRVKSIYPHLTNEHYEQVSDYMEKLVFPEGELEK